MSCADIIPTSHRAANASVLVAWLVVFGASGVPLSLLWDFSWESTVGIDRVWAGPHVMTYAAVVLAGLSSIFLIARGRCNRVGIRLGDWSGPLGAWVTIWGACAFAVALVFERWWQSSYGLAAGIWHPPQILKAVSFFAVTGGAWLLSFEMQHVPEQRSLPQLTIAGAAVLELISVVSLTSLYANRQHSAGFYIVACSTYPMVIMLLAIVSHSRWLALGSTLAYSMIFCLMIWILPLVPAKPLVAPVYNNLDHLMAPPFPLLLVLPALAFEVLLRHRLWSRWSNYPGLQAIAAGLTFFVILLASHWVFAEFLLSDLAENRFFAGGGTQWPFFLKIDFFARQAFWGDTLSFKSSLVALGCSIGAATLGLAFGNWVERVRR